MAFEGLIEVAVGLALVYSLLSVFASGLSEVTESFVRRRATFLEAGILDMLGETVHQFYEHPLIESVQPDKGRPRRTPKKGEPLPTRKKGRPSYIPSRIFSATILSLLTNGRTIVREPVEAAARSGALSPGRAVDEVEHNLAALGDGQLKRSVGAFIASSGRDYDVLRAEIERWYDDKMDRVSGWYKRRTRVVLLIWSIAIAVACNADTIVLAKSMYGSSALRASLVAAAQSGSGMAAGQPCSIPATPRKAATPAAPSGSLTCVADQVGRIRALRTPLGWSTDGPAWPKGPYGLLLKVLGLLITAAALTLGAPFWFDLLNKFVNVRATGQPPPKHGEPSRATQPPPGAGEAGTTRA